MHTPSEGKRAGDTHMLNRKPSLRHVITDAGGMERLSRALGKPARTYITVVRTDDGTEEGGTELLFPAEQNPLDGVQLLEDGAHRLTCDGNCQDCRG